MTVAGMPARAEVIGTPVSVTSFQGAVQALAALVEAQQGGYVCPANAYSLVLCRDDAHYRGVVDRAPLVTADGMPVVWALRWLRHRQAERVHNDDLCLAACAQHPHWRHYLVGGREGQPEEVARALQARFPGIQVVGCRPTPQRPVPAAHTQAIVDDIRASGATVVWVGLGTPAQDFWMHTVAGQVGAPMVGVGSLFDLLAGRTRAAPDWMKRNGLQWLFRLAQEPRRLFTRYAVFNTRFVLALAGQLARRGRA